jgi:hypothetical protein
MVMSQYDNTDSGAVFPPRDNHKMILQGKANNNGNESQMIVTMSTLPDGRKIMDVYEKTGTLFPNQKKTSDSAPDYTGPIGTRRIAAWKKTKDNLSYMSLSFSDKMEGGNNVEQQAQPIDDDVPF